MSEEDLVQRLVQIAAMPSTVQSSKSSLHGSVSHVSPDAIPSAPSTATDQRHIDIVAYLRRTGMLGSQAGETPESSFGSVSADQETSIAANGSDATFEWSRMIPPLNAVFNAKSPQSTACSDSWQTPFCSSVLLYTDGEGVDHMEHGALSAVVNGFAAEEAKQTVDLSNLPLSPSALQHAFRFGVRCALLSAPRESVFLAEVALLAKACSLPSGAVLPASSSSSPSSFEKPTRLDAPHHIYPFLKIYSSSTKRERKKVKKLQLKRLLDHLQKHDYYTPAAFALRKQYLEWITTAALSIHTQLLKLSEEIHDLKKQEKALLRVPRSWISKYICCGEVQGEAEEAAIAGSPSPDSNGVLDTVELASLGGTAEGNAHLLALQDTQTSGPSILQRGSTVKQKRGFEYVGSNFSSLPVPPAIPPRRTFGTRPSLSPSELAKFTAQRRERRMERRMRNEERRRRRLAAELAKSRREGGSGGLQSPFSSPHRNGASSPLRAADSNALTLSPIAAEKISSDEPEESDDADQEDDTMWVRTPQQEKERTEYLVQRQTILDMHEAYAAQEKRRRDAEAILKDIGLESTIEGAEKHKSAIKSPSASPPSNASVQPVASPHPQVHASSSPSMHLTYAQLLVALLSLQLPDSPASASVVGLSKNDAAVIQATVNGDRERLSRGRQSIPSEPAASSSSAHTLPPLSFQPIHLASPTLQPTFDPYLSPAKRALLDSFASLYGVGPVFRIVCYLQVLSCNLNATQGYWSACADTLTLLEKLRSIGGWTTFELHRYIVSTERIMRWAGQCTANFMRTFEMPVNLKTKQENTEFKARRAQALALAPASAPVSASAIAEQQRRIKEEKRRNAMSARMKAKYLGIKPGGKENGVKQNGTATAAVIPQAPTNSLDDADDPEEIPVEEEAEDAIVIQVEEKGEEGGQQGKGNVSTVPRGSLLSMTATSQPDVLSSLSSASTSQRLNSDRRSKEPFKLCLDVVRKCWVVLTQESIKISMSNASKTSVQAASPRAGAVTAAAPPPKHRLKDYLGMRLVEAGKNAYEMMREAAKRISEPDEQADGRNSSVSESNNNSSPIHSDLTLSLLLHTVLIELAWLTRAGDKYFTPHLKGRQTEYYTDCYKHAFISEFTADAQRYITLVRVPQVLQLKASTDQAISSSPRDSAESIVLQSKYSSAVHSVFGLWNGLKWWRWKVDDRMEAKVQQGQQTKADCMSHATLEACHTMSFWFSPIVDSFVATLIARIEEEADWITPADASGTDGRSDPCSMQQLFDRLDLHVSQLSSKPLSSSNYLSILSAISDHVLLYVEKRLMQGKGGIVEELQIRWLLNQHYLQEYPPLTSLSDSDRDKHTARLLALASHARIDTDVHSAQHSRQSSASMLASAGAPSPSPSPNPSISSKSHSTAVTPALSQSIPKPSHKFGFSDLLPGVTGNWRRRVEEMKRLNEKLEQMHVELLRDEAPLVTHSPSYYTLQSLQLQSISFLASGLCAVVMPTFVYNLLYLHPLTGIPSTDRWPSAKVEKCFGEALGFVAMHVEEMRGGVRGEQGEEAKTSTFQTVRMSDDLIRELSMYILLEIYELFALELKNTMRTVVDGRAYFHKRDLPRTLTPAQLHRIHESMLIAKDFLTEVALVPKAWFDSTEALHEMSFEMAREMQLGPFASAIAVSAAVSSEAITATQIKSLRPPCWSSIPYLLLEIWRIEKLLAVCSAPTSTLIGWYETASDDWITKPAPSALHLRTPSATTTPMRLEPSASWANPARTPTSAAGSPMLSPAVGSPMTPAATKPSITVATVQPPSSDTSRLHPPPQFSLRIDVASPAAAASSSTLSLLPPVPIYSSGQPTPLMRSPVTATATTTSSSLLYPFAVVHLSRFDVFRLLQFRAAASSAPDSLAHEFVARTKKPERPREVEPPLFKLSSSAAGHGQGEKMGLLEKLFSPRREG